MPVQARGQSTHSSHPPLFDVATDRPVDDDIIAIANRYRNLIPLPAMEDDFDDTQPTQQATQAVVDPRRLGKQNSGFTDEEIADILCILYPKSDNARREVATLARENSSHVAAAGNAGRSTSEDYFLDDGPARFNLATGISSGHAIVLRLSAATKDPMQGFTFGRHPTRCDFCFVNDPLKRLSNRHFRIYVNEYGVLMLEDTSTNGTIVDETLLKHAKQDHETKRTLSNGSRISILLHNNANDLEFLVQVPRRDGEHEAAFRRNLLAYRRRVQELEEEAQTIRPGADGPPDLFPERFWGAQDRDAARSPLPVTDDDTIADERLPREWNGSDKYNRIGQIGKGAFATVHKVTSKYDGKPYAAKELDKRRFMKNGVLDQKVENEMRIMRSVTHVNIVRYIDHFEWDNRLLIIVMEYVPLGDLSGFVQRHGCLAEQLVISTAKQLVSAIGYLHKNNITHRDVKPDNVLVAARDPFQVKLTDFGLSKMIDNDQTFLRTFCGTLLYCAPEVYSEYADYDDYGRRQPRRRHGQPLGGQRYDHAVDLWSLGGVLFYTLSGQPPFPVKSGASYAELLHEIMTKPLNLNPLRARRVSPKGLDCLNWMLHRRPEQRATVEQVENHPWLGGKGPVSRALPEAIDESSEVLGPLASQLSLEDQPVHGMDVRGAGAAEHSDDEILDDEDSLLGILGGEGSDDTWSQKENNQNSQNHTQDPALGGRRLFGEVNVSAISSSGAIPETRLNLPAAADSPSTSAEFSRDSFGSESVVDPDMPRMMQFRGRQPRHSQPRPPPQSSLPEALRDSMEQNQAAHESNMHNITFNFGLSGESLGDTGSILQTLNVESHAGFLGRSQNDFNSSKRRKPPSLDTSDEMDDANAPAGGGGPRHPTFKRLRSEGSMMNYTAGPGDHGNSTIYDGDRDDSDNDVDVGYGQGQGHGHGGEDQADESQGDYGDDQDREESELIATVPQILHMQSGRQMDYPVSKTAFWQANDRKTWHLDYPEMTQLQHDAFTTATIRRGEEFSPGRSPLWNLAMTYFPPSTAGARQAATTAATASTNDSEGGGTPPPVPAWKRPSTSMPPPPPRSEGGSSSHSRQPTPDTASQAAGFATGGTSPGTGTGTGLRDASAGGIVVPMQADVPEKRVVATLQSTPDSAVQNISVLVRESLTSFGRADDNTQVHTSRMDVKVPKYAFKLLVWKTGGGGSGGGFEPWRQFRPWGDNNVTGSGGGGGGSPAPAAPQATTAAAASSSSAASSFHFYISTKATNGIRINDLPLLSHEPKNASSPSRHWARLHDGDTVVIWGDERRGQAKLVFRCAWGGSATPRNGGDQHQNQNHPHAQAAVPVSEDVAARLDDACARAEKRFPQLMADDALNAAAAREYAQRMRAVEVERRRSRAFESRRLEALRAVGLAVRRGSSRSSAASAPLTTTTATAGFATQQLPATQQYGTGMVGLGWGENGSGRSISPLEDPHQVLRNVQSEHSTAAAGGVARPAAGLFMTAGFRQH